MGGLGGRKLDADLLDEWEEQLILSDVSVETATTLVDELRDAARSGKTPTDEAAQDWLKTRVIELLGPDTQPLQFNPNGLTVWLFIGVNGVGKTTSIGKMAHRLVEEGHKPLLAAGDTFRAAASEQLAEWGPPRRCARRFGATGRRSGGGCFRCLERGPCPWLRHRAGRYGGPSAQQN